jgi:type IV pilus assembly protein PilE
VKLLSKIGYKREKGFTLIEILVVLAAVGTIISIGYPAFQTMLQNKRHLQGETMLLDILQQQETYYSANSRYTAQLDNINYNPSLASKKNKIFYTIEARACSGQTIAQCIQLIASPIVEGDSYFSVTSVSDTLVPSNTKP